MSILPPDDTATCPRCGCSCRVGPHHSAHCVQCFTSFRTDQQPEPITCPRCGDGSACGALISQPDCPLMREREREPQGESVRLFEPAPTQLPGQMGFLG